MAVGARTLPLSLSDFPFTICTIADSLGEPNPYWNVTGDLVWPAQLGDRINAVGGRCKVRNFGIGGNTSSMMLARFASLFRFDTPAVVCIYAGANDRPAEGAVSGGGATTTVIPLAAGGGAMLEVGGYVEITGQVRKVVSRATDTITLETALPGAPANATAVWSATRRNIFEMAKLSKALGCNRVLVMGQHFKNWSSGGDTTSSEETYYAACRDAQEGAVSDAIAASVDAVYADNYAYERGLILAGTYSPGDNLTSAVANNQHRSLAGHTVLAASAFSAVQTKPEWLNALGA